MKIKTYVVLCILIGVLFQMIPLKASFEEPTSSSPSAFPPYEALEEVKVPWLYDYSLNSDIVGALEFYDHYYTKAIAVSVDRIVYVDGVQASTTIKNQTVEKFFVAQFLEIIMIPQSWPWNQEFIAIGYSQNAGEGAEVLR